MTLTFVSKLLFTVCTGTKVWLSVCKPVGVLLSVNVPVLFMSAPEWNVFACVLSCKQLQLGMLNIPKQCNGWKHASYV